MPDGYSDLHARDQAAQGRMILVAIAAAYIGVWVLSFVSYPILLVPGFVLDKSLFTAEYVCGQLFQFFFFSFGLLLTWAGVGWVRYVLALAFLLSGLFAVIVSMQSGAFGGAMLFLGVIELVAAGALVMSVGIVRYLEDRRRRGVPWLSLCLSTLGLFAVLGGVVAYELVAAGMKVATDRRMTATASAWIEQFAPDLNPRVLEDSASESFKSDLNAPGYVEQFTYERAQLGAFRTVDLPKPGVPARLLLKPDLGSDHVYTAVAHYEKGSIRIAIQESVAGPVPVITGMYCETIDPKSLTK